MIQRRLNHVVIACLALLVGGPSIAASPPNVLLIVSDDQRPDTLSALGNDQIHTPHLDELGKRGTVFTRAVAPNPICTPSRAEILSGCTGFRNGVFDFGKRLAPDLTLWPQTMRAAGYHTWYVGKWDLGGKPTDYGYESTEGLFMGGSRLPQTYPHNYAGRVTTGYQGWVFHNDDGTTYPDLGVGLTPDISHRFADAAIRFLQRKHDRPFFLHVNFTAPHDPLLVPPGKEERAKRDRIHLPANFLPDHPFDHGNLKGRDELLWPGPRMPDMVRAELAAYYAVIEAMDEQIGRMLTALEDGGETDNTLIIFTSDQGVAIGSHGLRGKQNMYEHTIGVPLIIRGPHVPAGRHVTGQCYLRDLYPTICALAGVREPEGLDGRSLVPMLQGRVREVHPYMVGYFRDVQRMIRTDRWKLIIYPQAHRRQLFDLANDPDELHDLSTNANKQQVIDELLGNLKEWQRENGDRLNIE